MVTLCKFLRIFCLICIPGFLGTIKPDQMQALNALFIILLIPLFEAVVYPLLKRPKPLKRMAAGMFLASVAFLFAGFLQMKIQSEEVVKNTPLSGQANVQVLNTLHCPVTVAMENKSIKVDPQGHSTDQQLSTTINTTLRLTAQSATCYSMSRNTFNTSLDLQEKNWYNLVVYQFENQIFEHTVRQNIHPPLAGKSRLCTVILPLAGDDKTFDISLGKSRKQENVVVLGEPRCTVIPAEGYELKVKGSNSSKEYATRDIVVRNGGSYIAVVQENNNNEGVKVTLYEDLPPRNVSLLYQIPQYFVITSGEILFSVTGLEFAYSQAPTSMKSCLQAAWLMTVAFGNLIVVIEAESRLFSNQTTEFFFFSAMLFAVMLVFMVMSFFYQYVDSPSASSEAVVPVPVDTSDDKVGIAQMDELAQI